MLLKQNFYGAACRGTLVVLTMGDQRYSLEFDLALKLSAAIRQHARIAKLCSGNHERGIRALGVLHDATAAKPRRKRFVERMPELLKPHGLDVGSEGQLVVLRVKRTTAKLPYPEALTLAQWIRVRGKEAKQNAGEPRHWSEVANMPAVVNGARPW